MILNGQAAAKPVHIGADQTGDYIGGDGPERDLVGDLKKREIVFICSFAQSRWRVFQMNAGGQAKGGYACFGETANEELLEQRIIQNG